MKNVIVLLALIVSLTLFSCDKETNNVDDSAPTIDILLPNVQQEVVNGDTININALIVDNDQLHDIKGAITRQRENQIDTVWNFSTHSHFNEFILLGMYIVKDAAQGDLFTFTVKATDHNGNLGEKSLDIPWRN